MVSAVSAAVSRSLTRPRRAASTSTPTPRSAGQWKFFRVPDLSTEMLGQINKARALPAYVAVCRLIDQQAFRGTAPRRKGETKGQRQARNEDVRRRAREENVIGIGIHAVAREAGIDPKAARRQLKKLHTLGVVAVHTRGITVVADPSSGRVTENRIGRTPPALIYLTVTPDQLRPSTTAEAKARLRVADCPDTESVGGADRPHPAAHNRGRFAPPSTDCTQTSQETPTDTTTAEATGRTAEDGHGLQADTASVLTDAEAGRHSPAKAVLGEGSIVTVDPSRKGLTVTDATRIPAGGRPTTSTGRQTQALRVVAPPDDRTSTRSPTPPRSTRSPDAGRDAEGVAPPQWPAEDQARIAAARAAYERQRAEDERNNPPVDRRAARKAAAEAGLIEAVAALPASSVAACRQLGRQIEAVADSEPDPASEAAAEALKALIERKRAESRGVSRKAAKATKDAFREAYRAEAAST